MVPYLRKAAQFYEWKQKAHEFYRLMTKIQSRLHDGINYNRKMMNYLQI